MDILPRVINFASQWWSIMEGIVLITLLILFSFSAITFCVYFTNTHKKPSSMGDEKCFMWEISMCAHKKVEFARLTFICEWTPAHAHTSTLMIDNLFHLTLFSWLRGVSGEFCINSEIFISRRFMWSQNTSPIPLFVDNLVVCYHMMKIIQLEGKIETMEMCMQKCSLQGDEWLKVSHTKRQ